MAKEKAGWVKASGWLFILGILIAIVAGLFPDMLSYVTVILPILGFIIGLLGIAGIGVIDKTETNIFLLAVVALMAAGGAGNAFKAIDALYGGSILYNIVNNIGSLVVPAAVLISLKAIWQAGSTKF
jgi:hypothetical protein